MLRRLQRGISWPHVRAKDWRAVYEEMYAGKLATDDVAYKKIKKTVENAK